MTNKQVLRLLRSCGAVQLNSHFALTPKEIPRGSGIKRHFHSDTFVVKDRVFENAMELNILANEIAHRYLERPDGGLQMCDFVLGLEKGAIALANAVAYQLQIRGLEHVRAGYAEANPEGGFTIGRGFARSYRNHDVFIVEDIVVSGTSLCGAIDAVRENGGKPVCAYAICLRGEADTAGVPLHYLCRLEGTQIWPEEECLLCQDPAWGPQSVRLDVNKHGLEFFQRLGLPVPAPAEPEG